MKKLFKETEGMTIENSTVQERHEIWELLFNNDLIYAQNKSLDIELLCLGSNSFYMLPNCDGFVADHFPNSGITINIDFQEFKNRLIKK